MADKKKTIEEPNRDELAQLIADSLNKMNKGGEKIAYFLGGEETPTDFTDFISTGATMLDIAISNRPNGGIAVGRVTELQGLEGSGKSLVSAHILANTQKAGGMGVLIDTETAVNEDFFRAVGVNFTDLVYMPLDTVEEIFDAITSAIENIRKNDKDRLLTIVVDSIAAASTMKELEADFNKDGYATDKAIIISKAMRKITNMLGRERVALVFTNQLRHKMNAMPFSDPFTTSGGKALGFHASTRLRLSQAGKIKNKNGDVVGVKVKAKVIKNRLGPPHREAEFEVYFDRGIDDYSAWLNVLKQNKIIKQSGAWYTYIDTDTGEEIKFQSKDFPEFLDENEERKQKLYEEICNSVIMRYKTEFDQDGIVIEESSDE